MPELFDTSEKRIITVPNILSILHVALLPFIFHFLKKGDARSDLIAVLLICIGASLDIADGYIARRFNQTSNLGRILDPLADKIFTISILILLVGVKGLPIWYLIIVIARDFAIILCGLYVILSKHYVSESNLVGKFASFSFFPVILLYALELAPFALSAVYLSVALILLSVVSYARVYFALISGSGAPQSSTESS